MSTNAFAGMNYLTAIGAIPGKKGELRMTLRWVATSIISISLCLPTYSGELPRAKTVNITQEKQDVQTIVNLIKSQTAIAINTDAIDTKSIVQLSVGAIEFWKLLELVAEKTGSRIAIQGGQIQLKPLKQGTLASPASLTGPFRFTAHEVTIRGDVENGRSTYDIAIGVCWEPWLNTYRIDSTPKVDSVLTEQKNRVTTSPGGSRTFTSGNQAILIVRPENITRDVKSVAIKGSVKLTIADELLTFAIENKQTPPAQKGVKVEINKSGVDGSDWFVELTLHYPKSEVVWESHEYYWSRNNVLRVILPNGQSYKADEFTFEDGSIRYNFKNKARQITTGWKLEYRTPGPMREIDVPFELKEIKLP